MRGRQIRDYHVDIKGHRRPRKALPRSGSRRVHWWAHATFTWSTSGPASCSSPPAHPSSEGPALRRDRHVVPPLRRGDRPVPATTASSATASTRSVATSSSSPRRCSGCSTGPPTRRPPGPGASAGMWSVLDGLVTNLGTETLRLLVYGPMPDVVRRRFDLPWSHSDRVAFTALCATIRAMDPAIRRGALDAIYPEGTPHPDRRDPTPPGRGRTEPPAAGAGRRPFRRLTAAPAGPPLSASVGTVTNDPGALADRSYSSPQAILRMVRVARQALARRRGAVWVQSNQRRR